MWLPITITITITGSVWPDYYYYYYYYSGILRSLLLLLLLSTHNRFITITITISNSLTTLVMSHSLHQGHLQGRHLNCYVKPWVNNQDKLSFAFFMICWKPVSDAVAWIIGEGGSKAGMFISLAKEIMFLVEFVCLFVCLFLCYHYYSKHYERIAMTFYGWVGGSKKNTGLNFGGDSVTHLVYKLIY